MPKQCLIIDDDMDDQEIFLLSLGKINQAIECRICNSGVEAVSMLDSAPDYVPGYIFIDVNMPKMNGLACLETLKNIKRLSNSKMFMYSTTSDPSTLEMSRKLGAHDFIIKPPKISELKEKLKIIFSDPHSDN